MRLNSTKCYMPAKVFAVGTLLRGILGCGICSKGTACRFIPLRKANLRLLFAKRFNSPLRCVKMKKQKRYFQSYDLQLDEVWDSTVYM
jgi:hypothetical protein